jgi:A/G-specific adenine glycosylase
LTRTAKLRNDLIDWFRIARRDLPWRVPTGSPAGTMPDPYLVLVSEAMLQQTQVVTVIDYFRRFIGHLPTIQDLAGADEQTVVRLWQGLGYYRRARNLHAASKLIVAEHGGVVPCDVQTLLTLPGIGRYTAGAIASLAYDRPAPIVDGNVRRVLARLDLITDPLDDKPVIDRLWARAQELVQGPHPSDLNSAMMELGATICSPESPRCRICPVRTRCRAAEAEMQTQVPAPRTARRTPVEQLVVHCIRRSRSGDVAWLFEQRPSKGVWAGMWQFPTRCVDAADDRFEIVQELGFIRHQLTHRRYEMRVVRSTLKARAKPEAMQWLTLEASDALPMSKAHLQVRAMIAGTKISKATTAAPTDAISTAPAAKSLARRAKS